MNNKKHEEEISTSRIPSSYFYLSICFFYAANFCQYPITKINSTISGKI